MCTGGTGRWTPRGWEPVTQEAVLHGADPAPADLLAGGSLRGGAPPSGGRSCGPPPTVPQTSARQPSPRRPWITRPRCAKAEMRARGWRELLEQQESTFYEPSEGAWMCGHDNATRPRRPAWGRLSSRARGLPRIVGLPSTRTAGRRPPGRGRPRRPRRRDPAEDAARGGQGGPGSQRSEAGAAPPAALASGLAHDPPRAGRGRNRDPASWSAAWRPPGGAAVSGNRTRRAGPPAPREGRGRARQGLAPALGNRQGDK